MLGLSASFTLYRPSFQEGLPYSVNFIGKGDKERDVFLSATAQTALYQWLAFSTLRCSTV